MRDVSKVQSAVDVGESKRLVSRLTGEVLLDRSRFPISTWFTAMKASSVVVREA